MLACLQHVAELHPLQAAAAATRAGVSLRTTRKRERTDGGRASSNKAPPQLTKHEEGAANGSGDIVAAMSLIGARQVRPRTARGTAGKNK